MGEKKPEKLKVEVAYAKPYEQKILSIEVDVETTVFDAVLQSGIIDYFPEIELHSAKMGVFGKIALNPQEQRLIEGDRIEVYRPLIADPIEIRKKRAKRKQLKPVAREGDGS
ncbi:MAG: RnfH family protein [Candidatus Endonucleobacter sp. (ex Gigantidas childressi)]|nr:RnfH family protein [Candidatus Endonucleobacter sp. (ex Gigantidas childressi)]